MSEDIFICVSCGKTFPEATKFCSDCGGKVKSHSNSDVKFICSKCDKEFAEKWNFCYDCAGKIVTTIPYSYICSQCGNVYEQMVKFCLECGGKIDRSGGVLDDIVAEQEEPQQSSQAEFCPGCGENTFQDNFCTSCGYSG